MSDLRTAAQQALEALEEWHGAYPHRVEEDDIEIAEALRAALVEDAMQKFADVNQELMAALGCDHCNHPLYAAVKCRVCGRVTEPVQEPVAWNWMLDGQPYGQAYYGNPPDADIVERAAISGRTVRLLYTAPSQRKPLTEEEILSLFRVAGSPVEFARAIERAHGIT